MHRAKHRAAGSSAVLATTLIERFADVPAPRTSGSRQGTATLEASDAAPGGPALFGGAPSAAPMLAVPDGEVPPDEPASLFGDAAGRDDLVPETPFGASRHSRRPGPVVPAPRVPGRPFGPLSSMSLTMPGVRPQPVGAVLGVTVLGAAAAVTAVVVPPPSAVEITGSLAPIQVPAPAAVPAVAPGLAPAPAPAALPDLPTVKVPALVTEVTGQMNKIEAPVSASIMNVANSAALTSPAAVRKAALTNALGKLGKPYHWGSVGPNAFDCSGLVKWSFQNAGKSLPRTSRAMASVGVPVKKADLQPGDLVFFYTPISHVGIYLGNNKIVHASRTGKPVMISDMSGMRFTTARRV